MNAKALVLFAPRIPLHLAKVSLTAVLSVSPSAVSPYSCSPSTPSPSFNPFQIRSSVKAAETATESNEPRDAEIASMSTSTGSCGMPFATARTPPTTTVQSTQAFNKGPGRVKRARTATVMSLFARFVWTECISGAPNVEVDRYAAALRRGAYARRDASRCNAAACPCRTTC
jgi:hypothetical protein